MYSQSLFYPNYFLVFLYRTQVNSNNYCVVYVAIINIVVLPSNHNCYGSAPVYTGEIKIILPELVFEWKWNRRFV